MDELLTDFLAETAEILAEAGSAIIAWEAAPMDRARLDIIFRHFHTIKGSSGFLDLPRVTALAHATEDALDQVRRGNRTADAALVTAVLAIVDRLSKLCATLGSSGSEPKGNDQDVIAALDTREGDGTALTTTDIALADDEELQTDSQNWHSIRVPLPLLDSVMTGVTDIVLARNEFAQQLRESGCGPNVIASFDRLSDSISGMRHSVSQMRMQRIDKLFAPLPRIVRDLAQGLNKKVKFTTHGGEVELDREMMENIRDPLIHIIRNAIDHGIETLEGRVVAGKDVTASISVTARQSGNQIEIEISDDGKGLSPERLIAKALEAKIIASKDVATLSLKDTLDLIFAAGFSTAANVTAISGRGVGMDIVRSNLGKIGGVVEIKNDEGRGLTIILRVPMTLTIISGLLVTAAGQYFAVPRGAVREILLETNAMVRVEKLGGGEVATVRGKRLPLLRLESVLGCDPLPDEDPEDRALMIIRPGQGQAYALSVAAIHDHEELVIKPAAPMIMATNLYAGTTLTDNGKPVLLLDVKGLVEVAAIDISETERSRDAEERREEANDRNAEQILLFRDRDTRVRAVRLSVVERVEDVPASLLFESAGTVHVTIGDDIFPVHMNELPDRSAMAVKLVRMNDGVTMLCYPIEGVIDIVRMPKNLQAAKEPGLIAGVMLVGGEPVELIDPFWLMQDYGNGAGRSAAMQRQPLCRLAEDTDGWATNFLAPILRSSGYRVITGSDMAAHAVEVEDVFLCMADSGSKHAASSDVPVVRLRTTPAAAGPEDDSIYRYDRAAVLSALRRHVAGDRK